MQRHTSIPFWRDVRILLILGQVAFVLVVAIAAGFFYANASTAMRRQGLVTGFDFLSLEAGFEIGETLIPYTPADTYSRAFTVGLLNTLTVSGIGIVLATILGVIAGVARLSTNWLVNKIAWLYIEIMRNTPLLVQLVFIYFGIFMKLPPVRDSLELGGIIFVNQRGVFLPRVIPMPTLTLWLVWVVLGLVAAILVWFVLSRHPRTRDTQIPFPGALGVLVMIAGFGWLGLAESPLHFEVPIKERFNFIGGTALSPEFSALLFGLVIYTAAFIAEVVRGGIQAVKRGQIEAARALGLGEMQILHLIIFPLALRIIVPPLTSQYLNLAKNSSLAIGVGFPDLFNVSMTIANQTGQPVPVIMIVMTTYLAMSLFTSLLMNIYNRYVQVLEK